MLCVLGLDFPAAGVLPSHQGETAARHRPVPADEEQVAVLVDDLVELADGQPVLLVYPQRRAGEVVRLVRLLRQVLGASRIAAVPTGLPPLAAGVLVELLAALAEPLELDAGRAAAAVPELERRLQTLCWVPTVRNLEDVALWQHLLSWAAFRGFAYRPGVGSRWIRKQTEPEALTGIVAVRGESAWLRGAYELGGTAVVCAGHPDATKEWFGTGRAAEVVVVPDDLAALAREVGAALEIGDCGWCGLPGPGAACAFCGMVGTGMVGTGMVGTGMVGTGIPGTGMVGTEPVAVPAAREPERVPARAARGRPWDGTRWPGAGRDGRHRA